MRCRFYMVFHLYRGLFFRWRVEEVLRGVDDLLPRLGGGGFRTWRGGAVMVSAAEIGESFR